ncbi:xaa-Pro aminopeptidase [Musa troglodytarum]|uniref:Xaa-Pro aminopeptidase n=1 Tax=Musa troglodytarum TaxID=320322 RepID=A0A9E7E7Z6_9LILI|nr:xaa-Pro aminopeptidase [Musa troglodytarum]
MRSKLSGMTPSHRARDGVGPGFPERLHALWRAARGYFKSAMSIFFLDSGSLESVLRLLFIFLLKVIFQSFSNLCGYVERVAYATKRTIDFGQPTSLSHPELVGEDEITPGIATDEYISRRKRLLELLPEKSLAIIASAPVKMMTDVVPYPFRQDADFLYITGCLQPGGIAVLSEECGLCMFMPDPDPHDAVWQGQVAGVEAALEFFKADKAFPLSVMHKILPQMMRQASRLFHNVKTASPSYTEMEPFYKASFNNKVKDLSTYTHELQWIKSASELKLMRTSASIACQSLLQTMLLSRIFPEESKLSAKVEYECKMRGAQRMAFNPVVGGGVNGSIIHYSRNDQKIRAGDLVLMDVGCEFHGYLSDLTRTWPPCGSFSPAQLFNFLLSDSVSALSLNLRTVELPKCGSKFAQVQGCGSVTAEECSCTSNKFYDSEEILYSLILETNKECLKLCRPGISLQQIHNYSVKMLRRGLKDIGVLNDEASYLYHQLNPTSIGHYLGMDIHDCAMINNDRPLEPGVVITIEPGVYIPSSYDGPERFDLKYGGVGIRIEDEVLITETGHEVLTGSMPKEIQHIKSLLNYTHSEASEASDLRTAFN